MPKSVFILLRACANQKEKIINSDPFFTFLVKLSYDGFNAQAEQ
jgi:hypothetical protein